MAIKKDGRKNNGGPRPNSGRKPKADEIKLIEKLTPMDALAFRKLKAGVNTGNYKFLELFLKYRWGNPKQHMDITSDGNEIKGIPLIDFFKTAEEDDKNKR